MTATTLLLATLLSAGAHTGSQVGDDRTIDKSFTVERGAELSLDSHKGTIKIRTHDKSEIEVHIRIWTDDEDSVQLIPLVDIEQRARPSGVKLEVDYDRATSRRGTGFLGNSWNLPYVDFDILVPDDAQLELDSHKSTFDLEVPSGRIEINSHKGTGTIHGVRNRLSLNTHKGEFDVIIDQLDDLDINTHKGELNVVIRGARDFSIRGASHKGKLEFSGLDVRVERDGRSSYVNHREGSGGSDIGINTHKGDIRLNFE